MVKPLDNYAVTWSRARPPKHSARVSSLRAIRMLVKLGGLHQSLRLRPTRNPGAAWGSTYLDRPCEQGPNVVLGTTMLRWERPEVTLVQFGIL
jgi:hypothetical protein